MNLNAFHHSRLAEAPITAKQRPSALLCQCKRKNVMLARFRMDA